jgi:leucyl aminopeptidase (aminopeptidase T)
MLDKAALNILKVCMGLKENESFLVVFDKNKRKIANFLLKRALKICRKAKKIEIPVGKVNGQEPPKNVALEMQKYVVVVMVTSKSLSHTNARRNASAMGVRIASMPGATIDMIERTMSADYNRVKEVSERILKLYKGRKLRLITAQGTDVTLDINKSHFTDIGFYTKKGDFGNLPAGEVGFAPVEGKTKGVVVFDKSVAGIGKLHGIIKIEVKKGFAVKIDGSPDAKKLDKILRGLKDRNVYNIAEFSIGTNYKAKITGITLEDEKVYGTVHIALGDNTSYPGGTIKASTHLDGVISKPTLFIDGVKVMEKGKLVI